MSVRKRRVLSIIMSMVMAFSMVSATALTAFADELQATSFLQPQDAVYDAVYGSLGGKYALMYKKATYEFVYPNGDKKIIEGYDADVMRADGKVTVSTTIDPKSETGYALDSRSGGFSASMQAGYLPVRQRGLAGALTLDGGVAVPCQYDVTQPCNGDIAAVTMSDSSARVDFYTTGGVACGSLNCDFDVSGRVNLSNVSAYSNFVVASFTISQEGDNSGYNPPAFRSFVAEKSGSTYREADGVATVLDADSDGGVLLAKTDNWVYFRSADGAVVRLAEYSNVNSVAGHLSNSLIQLNVGNGPCVFKKAGCTELAMPEGYLAEGLLDDYVVASKDRDYNSDDNEFAIVDANGQNRYEFTAYKADVLEMSENTYYTTGSTGGDSYVMRVYAAVNTKLAEIGISSHYAYLRAMKDSEGNTTGYELDNYGRKYFDTDFNEISSAQTGPNVKQYEMADGTAVTVTYSGGEKGPSFTVTGADGKAITRGGYTLAVAADPGPAIVSNSVKHGNADLWWATDSAGKWGAIDTYGAVLVPFKYDSFYDAGLADTDYALVKEGSEWKFLKVSSAPVSIAGATVTVTPSSYKADGTAKTPQVAVELDGTTLNSATDYDVAYSDNVAPGAATVTVTGKGGYTGTATGEFTIYAIQEDNNTQEAVTADYSELDVTLAENEEKLNLEVATVEEPSAEAAATKVAGVSDENFKVYSVELRTLDQNGNEVRKLDGEEGNEFGTLTITFDLGAEAAGKFATVKQIHGNEVFKHCAVTVPADGKLPVGGIYVLSEFTISLQNQFKVSFDSDGGTAYPDQYVVEGAKADNPGNPTKAGYTFKEWRLDDKKYDFNAPVTKVTALKAVYEKNATPAPKPAAESATMYRLYNQYTGEHFYTASAAERDKLSGVGWTFEGIGWTAPKSSKTPVYRLYNPYAPGGDHHYTTNATERDNLVKLGWTAEGTGWYSDDAQSVPLYRQYNPYAQVGTHNYTTSKAENDKLVSLGWQEEGVAWYGVK